MFLKFNAYSTWFVNHLKKICAEGFDIIIDDGPHTLISQVMFIKKYLPLLNQGGIMIIEDIIVENIRILIDQVTPDYKYNIFNLTDKKNKIDDIIMTIK